MVHQLIRLLFTFFTLILLTNCSITPSHSAKDSPLSMTDREQKIQAMQQFRLQASLGVKAPNESISGNLRWVQHNEQTFNANLTNFLGINLFEINQNEQYSEITVKGDTYSAVDTSTLLLQLTGWSLPLDNMSLWLRGLPDDKSRHILRDEFGRVIALTLTDSTGSTWKLEYQAFFPDNLTLPKRLLLQNNDTQIKVVIRNWQ